MPDQNNPPHPQLAPELRKKVLVSAAIRQSMLEILAENRTELVKRAQAKLKAYGIAVRDDELDPSGAV